MPTTRRPWPGWAARHHQEMMQYSEQFERLIMVILERSFRKNGEVDAIMLYSLLEKFKGDLFEDVEILKSTALAIEIERHDRRLVPRDHDPKWFVYALRVIPEISDSIHESLRLIGQRMNTNRIPTVQALLEVCLDNIREIKTSLTNGPVEAPSWKIVPLSSNYHPRLQREFTEQNLQQDYTLTCRKDQDEIETNLPFTVLRDLFSRLKIKLPELLNKNPLDARLTR